MANTAGALGRILESVLTRPQSYRSRRRSSRGQGETGFSGFRPNAPRMVTVLASIALAIVGLVVTGTVEITWVTDRLNDVSLTLSEDDGYICLLASPLLLVAGSLLRGL